MPTVLRIKSYRFHFYSDELNEPPHIHAETNEGECKFWLQPVKLAKNKRVKKNKLREIEKLIYDHLEFLIEKYNEFHKN